MSKFEATIEHFATRAKAYAAGISTALAGVDLTVVPQPYSQYLAIALPILGFIAVFKVPNRREVLDADVEAAREAFDAIKAAGAPAADQPHPPAENAAPPQAVEAPPAPTVANDPAQTAQGVTQALSQAPPTPQPLV